MPYRLKPKRNGEAFAPSDAAAAIANADRLVRTSAPSASAFLLLFERTSFDSVLDGFRRYVKCRHGGVALVADLRDARGMSVIRVHHHLARPGEEADTRRKLGRAVL